MHSWSTVAYSSDQHVKTTYIIWYMSVILALKRLTQKYHEYKASPGLQKDTLFDSDYNFHLEKWVFES